MSKEEYIKKIAALDGSNAVTELAEELKDELDLRLMRDNALEHFGYEGEEDRKKQLDFLAEQREELEERKGEFESLGHNWSKPSLVAIDKLLQKVDLLLSTNQPDQLKRLLAGDCSGVCADNKILPGVATKYDEVMESASEIRSAVSAKKTEGLDDQLKQFEKLRTEYAQHLETATRHAGLNSHFKRVLLGTIQTFAGGSEFQEAVKLLVVTSSMEDLSI